MDCSPPGSSVLGISQQEYQSGLQCPSPGDFPDPSLYQLVAAREAHPLCDGIQVIQQMLSAYFVSALC